MITVYYARAKQLVEKSGFDKCLSHLEERRKDKVLRTGDELSQVRSLATGELLYLATDEYLKQNPEMAGEVNMETVKSFETEVFPGGKPYFKHYPKIYFNLSHSGEYVCCAMGAAPVGVDIQKHVSVKEGLAKRFFTEEENRMLRALDGEERERWFFRMWSIKESYIKYTGLGMKQGIDTFCIDWKSRCIYSKAYHVFGAESPEQPEAVAVDDTYGVQAYFSECMEIEGYSMALCTKAFEEEICWCDAELIRRL